VSNFSYARRRALGDGIVRLDEVPQLRGAATKDVQSTQDPFRIFGNRDMQMNRLSQKAEARARSPMFAWSTEVGWKTANARNSELCRGALKVLKASRKRSSNFVLHNVADAKKSYVRVGSTGQEVIKGGLKLAEWGSTFRLTIPLDVSALQKREGFFKDGQLTQKAELFLRKSFRQAIAKGAPLHAFRKVPMTFIPVTVMMAPRVQPNVIE
jgi:hypothetical protein